jgi:hypothetical protein
VHIGNVNCRKSIEKGKCENCEKNFNCKFREKVEKMKNSWRSVLDVLFKLAPEDVRIAFGIRGMAAHFALD